MKNRIKGRPGQRRYRSIQRIRRYAQKHKAEDKMLIAQEMGRNPARRTRTIIKILIGNRKLTFGQQRIPPARINAHTTTDKIEELLM